jgi:hypothetical protein
MSIKDFLKQEQDHRLSQKWWIFDGEVIADNGNPIKVRIKSFGFYNQILKFGDSEINHCSGHTIDKVKKLHNYLSQKINEQSKPSLVPVRPIFVP